MRSDRWSLTGVAGPSVVSRVDKPFWHKLCDLITPVDRFTTTSKRGRLEEREKPHIRFIWSANVSMSTTLPALMGTSYSSTSQTLPSVVVENRWAFRIVSAVTGFARRAAEGKRRRVSWKTADVYSYHDSRWGTIFWNELDCSPVVPWTLYRAARIIHEWYFSQ